MLIWSGVVDFFFLLFCMYVFKSSDWIFILGWRSIPLRALWQNMHRLTGQLVMSVFSSCNYWEMLVYCKKKLHSVWMCVFKKFPQKLLRYDTKLVLRSIKKTVILCSKRQQHYRGRSLDFKEKFKYRNMLRSLNVEYFFYIFLVKTLFSTEKPLKTKGRQWNSRLKIKSLCYRLFKAE